MKSLTPPYFYSCINIIVWLFLFLLLDNSNGQFIGQLATILLLINTTFLIVRAIKVKNILLLTIFIFMILYIWPAKLFFFDNIFFSAHNTVYTYYTAAFVSLLFLLYNISLLFFIKFSSSSDYNKLQFRSNDRIFWGVYILALIIIILFKRSGSHYDGSGGDVQVSSLYEYDLILFLIIYIYSNNEKKKIYLFYLLCSLYIFFTIISGGRIEVVLLGFLLLVIRIQYIFPFYRFTIFLALSIWLMSVFETIRETPMLLYTNNIIDLLNPFAEKNTYLDFQVSNEGDVFWASERIIILIKEGVISITDRIQSAFYYFISSIIPSSILPPIANLANYRIDLYSSGGGGLAVVYFYTMFGLLGVVGLGYLFSYMLNLLYKKLSPCFLFYIILMITTYARWFVYNPIFLVKYCVLGTVCFYLISKLDYTVNEEV